MLLTRLGNADLLLELPSLDSLTIQCQYRDPTQRIEQIRFDDGVLGGADFALPIAPILGSPDADQLVGSVFDETLLGLGGDDTLDGAEGDDQLIGGARGGIFAASSRSL